MSLHPKIAKLNFNAFLWHAAFLAFAKNFMDADTIIPAMIIETGGSSVHIGLMTVIILSGSRFAQLFFAPYISNRAYKKKFLLAGINLRILALFALGFILLCLKSQSDQNLMLWFIFIFITLFSLGGAFTNISYTDILGKAVDEEKRKTFFSAKQIIAGVVFIISAFIAKSILARSAYPINYALLFITGASLLFIASIGFWLLRESFSSFMGIKGFKDYMTALKKEIINNRKMLGYLGFINTQGIIISFLPFVMLYAKQVFNTQSIDTGNFLLYKVIGIVVVSMIVLLAATKVKYRFLMYLNVVLSVFLTAGILMTNDEFMLKYIFIFSGVAITIYNITMNGLLLEVSDRSNRALFTGFAGAGHIIPTIFPLSGGWIIDKFGFQPFFIIYILIILASLYFIPKIACTK